MKFTSGSPTRHDVLGPVRGRSGAADPVPPSPVARGGTLQGMRPLGLDLATAPSGRVRGMIRDSLLTAPTDGYCMDVQQANLVVVPEDVADDFERFCDANPAACPLLERGAAGSASVQHVARDVDLRTDLPRYRVFSHGTVVDEPTDVLRHWRSDSVAFLLGCSLGFEAKLTAAGVPVRHLQAETKLPMYATSVGCVPIGPFGGPLVVSLRPVPEPLVAAAEAITRELPWCHGGPVHIGQPDVIGIGDLDQPDFGDPPVFRPGDVPMFWACGVTPQLALPAAGLPYAITHYPGHMLITDIPIDTPPRGRAGPDSRRRHGVDEGAPR